MKNQLVRVYVLSSEKDHLRSGRTNTVKVNTDSNKFSCLKQHSTENCDEAKIVHIKLVSLFTFDVFATDESIRSKFIRTYPRVSAL